MIRCPRKECRSTRVVVTTRQANYSAFNGYHRTPSDYSALRCLDCRWPWRSKAEGVDQVPNATDADLKALGFGPRFDQRVVDDAPIRAARYFAEEGSA